MLYIVSTPIGNLNDLSYRQAKTLAQSDIILAEDTRSAHTLFEYIKKSYKLKVIGYKIISYYKEIELQKLSEIINWLKEEKNISLISESGMPLISDPGYLLVKTCIKESLPFTVIPGPSAITTGLIYSGFNPVAKNGGFIFLGYFPKGQSNMYRLIDRLKQVKKIFPEMIFVFYESPNRITNTLQCFKTLEWNPDIVICREMTKKFEEIVRGKASDLLNHPYKGELTVILH